MNNDYFRTLEARLVRAVAQRLGVPVDAVTVTRWQHNRNGSQTPVFSIPATHAAQAVADGLTI